MKFGVMMQNHMRTMVKGSKWKPEVEFEYVGCLFLETRSHNNNNNNLTSANVSRDFSVAERNFMQ